MGGKNSGSHTMTEKPFPSDIDDALRFLQQQSIGNALLSVPLRRIAAHIECQAKEITRLNDLLLRAFDAGFTVCAAEWARRDDLLADIGSPAYLVDRESALAFLGLTPDAQAGTRSGHDQMLAVFAQVDAIHRLEGFEPTDLQKRLRRAILEGRVTSAQAAREMSAYAAEHHTLDGFLESRSWFTGSET